MRWRARGASLAPGSTRVTRTAMSADCDVAEVTATVAIIVAVALTGTLVSSLYVGWNRGDRDRPSVVWARGVTTAAVALLGLALQARVLRSCSVWSLLRRLHIWEPWHTGQRFASQVPDGQVVAVVAERRPDLADGDLFAALRGVPLSRLRVAAGAGGHRIDERGSDGQCAALLRGALASLLAPSTRARDRHAAGYHPGIWRVSGSAVLAKRSVAMAVCSDARFLQYGRSATTAGGSAVAGCDVCHGDVAVACAHSVVGGQQRVAALWHPRRAGTATEAPEVSCIFIGGRAAAAAAAPSPAHLVWPHPRPVSRRRRGARSGGRALFPGAVRYLCHAVCGSVLSPRNPRPAADGGATGQRGVQRGRQTTGAPTTAAGHRAAWPLIRVAVVACSVCGLSPHLYRLPVRTGGGRHDSTALQWRQLVGVVGCHRGHPPAGHQCAPCRWRVQLPHLPRIPHHVAGVGWGGARIRLGAGVVCARAKVAPSRLPRQPVAAFALL
eukprot:ctg_510.g305